MKLVIALLAVALPAAALAQPAADAPQTPASAGPAKAPANTISGVTVEAAKPQKACSSRDKACVAMVVAELKARFPNELQKWCDTVKYRAAVTNMNIDDLNGALGSPGTHSEAGQFAPPAVAKVACASDPKPK